MPYSFADIEPVKGVCIASWNCDNDGGELESVERSPIHSPVHVGIVDEIKKLSQAPRLIGGVGHISSMTSDTRVSALTHDTLSHTEDQNPSVHKLRALLMETQNTFHALMERNLALESEVAQLRARLNYIERPQAPQAQKELAPLPLGSTWTDQSSLNIFDISTPPTYKENFRPRAVARNHVTNDQRTAYSGRRPGNFTVFNS